MMRPATRRRKPPLLDAYALEIKQAREAIKREARTYNGVCYDSQWEARYAAQLDLLVQAGEVERWERQVTFLFALVPGQGLTVIERSEAKAYKRCRFVMSGRTKMRYSIDFRVHYADGRVELAEVKGYPRPDWVVKNAFWEAVYLPAHPDVTFRLLGQETFGK